MDGIDTPLGASYAPGMLYPTLQQAYERDPRRQLIASMMQTGQQSLQQPTLTPASALAKALTMGLAGVSGVELEHEYRDQNTATQGHLKEALAAMNGAPPPVGGDGLPSGPGAAPDMARASNIMASDPALAPMAIQSGMSMAQQRSKALIEQDSKFLESGVQPVRDSGGKLLGVVKVPGFSKEKAGIAADTARATAEATEPNDVKKATDIAAATAPIDVKKANQIQSFKDDAEPITVDIGGIKYPTTKGNLRAFMAKNAPTPPAPATGGAAAGTPAPGSNAVQAPPPAAAGGGAPPPAGAVAPPAAAPAPPTASPAGLKTIGPGTPTDTGIFSGPIGEDAKEVATARTNAAQGQKELATIQTIQDFLPKVRTGWGAENVLEGGRILQGLGVDPKQVQDFMGTNVGDAQLLTKKFLELSSAAARQMGAREPGSVIMMFGKAYPNLGTDQSAITLQTNALKMDRIYQQKIADEKTNFFTDSVNNARTTGQYRGLKGFNEDFNARERPENYLHAAEAMSGRPEAWTKSDPKNYDAIVGAMPSGTRYMAPDQQWRVRK